MSETISKSSKDKSTNITSTHNNNAPSSVIKTDDSSLQKSYHTTVSEGPDEYEKFLQLKKGLHSFVPSSPESKYLEDKVFPILLPIVEKTISKAKIMECLKHQKSLFNGVDYISQLLWNTNLKYPERNEKPLNIFLLPWTQEWLAEHPRPIFPKSWIWSKRVATIKIQSFVRGYFVRRTAEVQELRQFWKILEDEKQAREIQPEIQ